MLSLLLLWLGALIRLFRSRGSLVLENLTLRQQLAVLKRRHPRPSLGLFDKLFWVIARRVWSAWKESLIIVTPETVVRWHRTGFRMLCLAKTRSTFEINKMQRGCVTCVTWALRAVMGQTGFSVGTALKSLSELCSLAQACISEICSPDSSRAANCSRFAVRLEGMTSAIGCTEFSVRTLTFCLFCFSRSMAR